MIILDPEKADLMAKEQLASMKPYLPVTNHYCNSRSSRRIRRVKRFLKSLLQSLALLALFLGIKAIWSDDLYGGPGHGHGRGHMHGHGHGHGGYHHRMSVSEREELFLSVPNPESALAASRAYATHPHLAGSKEDFSDAQEILKLFQSSFNISTPSSLPIYPAGSPESRNSTLGITEPHSSNEPSAWIDVYYPVLNTPLNRSLDILGAEGEVVWSADLVEDGDPLDEEAHKYRDYIPTWHGLSFDAEVEGNLVYANYGMKEDYDELVEAGTDFSGKIMLVRYGGIYRGLKVKRAEELGAAGVLIYSDTRDDGFVTVANGYAPYPHGPARNPTSVQRGSVQYLSIYPGDPSTPGVPAYEDVERVEGGNIPKIPSLPISWANAQKLLEEIGAIYTDSDQSGNVEKRKLSGRHSESTIRLVNHVDTKVTPIWNTMASIPGHIKDEVVLIGCHRDAWVMGAADPISGTVSLHEIIRGFGELLEEGWKPLRTVVFASWDAEEQGLVGSTEYGEDFSEWISKYVVSYLNLDSSVSGSQWNAGGSPSLAHIIKKTALDVPHPTIPGKTLWDAREDQGPFSGPEEDVMGNADPEFMAMYNAAMVRKASKTGIAPLGSGSDYTVFLQRLGIASTDQGFGQTPTDSVYHYHSIYDSERWQEVYGDPGFHRHVAVAKHLGLLALRVTDSIILPLNTTQYALELDDYLDIVETLVPSPYVSSLSPDFSTLRASISALQTASADLDVEKVEAEKDLKRLLSTLPPFKHGMGTWLKKGLRRRIADWIKGVYGVESYRPQHPNLLAYKWKAYVDLTPQMDGTIIERRRRRWLPPPERDVHGHFSRDGHPPPLPQDYPLDEFIKAVKRVSTVNKKLMAFERGFISEGGIKDREWYKHLGVAPGKWLGYGATTLPALTESLAIEHNVTLAAYEARRLTELIDKLALRVRP